MRTLLFDIDGTLLITHNSGSGALKQAIEHEFQEALAGQPARIDIDFGGRTDRSIITELLDQNGITANPSNHGRLESRYKTLLPSVLNQLGGVVLPGVADLLDRLTQMPTVANYVMTGNLAQTGKAKLDHFGLLEHFRGVFGGDHDADRNDLARRAVKALARSPPQPALHLTPVARHDLVVIGDTVADIQCARSIGAKVIAVATGSHDHETLSAASPDALVDDLSDTEQMIDLLTR